MLFFVVPLEELSQFCNNVIVFFRSTVHIKIASTYLYFLLHSTTDFKFYSSPQVCSQIAAERAASPNLDKLYITKGSSSTGPADHLFMDTAVYSRNRCFRLAFSSKSGKKSFLVPSRRFKCKEMVSFRSHNLFLLLSEYNCQ